jgi:hypothetical protein
MAKETHSSSHSDNTAVVADQDDSVNYDVLNNEVNDIIINSERVRRLPGPGELFRHFKEIVQNRDTSSKAR